MHLIEAHSLCCGGAKIGLPFMRQEFYPTPGTKYITFNSNGKDIDKKYDGWNKVFEILLPKLNELNIKVLHLGGQNDEVYDGIIRLCGQTRIRHLPYIIERGLLHFGVDSFPIHIASWKQKKIVVLCGATFKGTVKPYWSKDEDYIFLSPDFSINKPTFSYESNPKRINEIEPEMVVDSIMRLLTINKIIAFNPLDFESSK